MTDVQLPPVLTVWGDFNCPWCALVGLRSDGLRANGWLEVDWRAVQHRPELPPSGVAPDRRLADEFDEVVKAADPGERQGLRLPGRVPNTAEPTQRFAALDPWDRPAARSRLFNALWHDDLDIGSPAVLELIGLPVSPAGGGRASGALALEWQAEWEELGVPVPALRDGEGNLSAGGPSCLTRLGELR